MRQTGSKVSLRYLCLPNFLVSAQQTSPLRDVFRLRFGIRVGRVNAEANQR
jgi:hypothetical protein